MVNRTSWTDQEVQTPQVISDNADIESADIVELLGVVSSAVNKLDGAGLEIVDGEVRVNSDVFDGNIEGLSNPMTADLDASGYNISNAGTIEGQALEAEDQLTVSDQFSMQFEDPLEKTEDRSLDTTYQNTTGNLLEVSVRLHTIDATSGTTTVDAFVGPSSDPVSARREVDYQRWADHGSSERTVFRFLIAPDQYYHIRDQDDNIEMVRWSEKEARSP